MVAREAALTAITRERKAASCTWAFPQADSNQRKESPSQCARESPALKAKTTKVAIGRYSRKKQIIAIVVKPGCRRMSKRLAMPRPRPAGIAHVNQQGHHHDGHERDRNRRAERPVAALAELQLDQ